MNNSDNPIVSKRKLVRNLIVSVVVGTLILLVAVLPAEFGIDPLGAGKALGFSKLYVQQETEMSVDPGQLQVGQSATVAHRKIILSNIGSSTNVSRPIAASLPVAQEKFAVRQDVINVLVPASKGIEYKIWAKQLGHFKYEWSTDQGELFLDFHGEPKVSEGFYDSYTVCYSNNMGGTFLVPFTGKHGWYFKNNSAKDITVTIKLDGEYELM